MKHVILIVCVVVVFLSSAVSAVEIETVPVGNVGNTGEFSGADTPGGGPDRSCGAVAYMYNIGKYEVTAGQYTEFLNAVAKTDTYGLYNERMDVDSGLSNSQYACNIKRTGLAGNYTYTVAPDRANRPVDYVSFWDACRFANWLGNGQGAGDTENGAYTLTTDGTIANTITRNVGATWVVTSEDEWYKAAYYDPSLNAGAGGYYDYPTSSDTAPGYVNDSGNLSGAGTSFTEGGTDPGNYATCDGDAGIDGIGSPYYRTIVGEWENSDSPYGTFDQGGNVSEWNEAIIGLSRGLRGGAFNGLDYILLASSRGSAYPEYEGYSLGFRVSEVPEPATLSMLALGGLAMLRRKRGSASDLNIERAGL